MAFFYLQESKEKNKFKFLLNNILNKIDQTIDENKIFLTLPIKENKKISNTKIKKIIKQIQKYNIKTLIY